MLPIKAMFTHNFNLKPSAALALMLGCVVTGLVCGLITCPNATARESKSHQVKSDSLKYLLDLRTRESRRLGEINESLTRKLDDSDDPSFDTEMLRLKMQQREHQLRQDFLNRLIFQVDTKFRGGDLRVFLQSALVDMARVDAVSSAQNDSGMWKFLKYSADAIRRLPEQKENILAFLEGYMNRSVSNPVPPKDYLAARNYTNGSVSEAGQPVSAEEAGSIADQRLQEMAKQAEADAATTLN